jgi:3-hydroxyisobutyrate dehydrogenase-like beta-hydroxyacid dehydrogenase
MFRHALLEKMALSTPASRRYRIMTTDLPRIGCIGLGMMGRPIATHLINAGYELVLYARRPEVFEGELKHLVDAGATIAEHPADLPARSDIVLLNVMAGQDVRHLTLDGPDAIITAARPGLLVVDHSTIDPATARDVHAELRKVGVGFIDAPVSGGAIGAEAGTLATMMGGEEEDIRRISPLLEHYTAKRIHMGAAGQGAITKLSNQIAQVITIQGVAEAMRFAGAHGADLDAVRDVLMSGFASSRMLELLGPKMISEDFTPGMESRLLDKDIQIAQASAQAQELSLPALDLLRKQISHLQECGWQKDDISILYKALEMKKS